MQLKLLKILKDEYGIGSRLYSITSYSELEKNAKSVLRQTRCHLQIKNKIIYSS